MTTTQEVKWEEITSIDVLKLGDELEYTCSGTNREFKYWGKVIHIMHSGETTVVQMEGDWTLVPSSLTACNGTNTLTRKVVEFVWPKGVGASVEATQGDSVYHYVRVDEYGNDWVVAETGERYRTWELELISSNYTHRVISTGE